MLERLKNQSLIGLALAIAGGYALAHAVIHLVDRLCNLYGEPDPWLATGISATAALSILFLYSWLPAKKFISRHKRKLALAILLAMSVSGFAIHWRTVVDKEAAVAAFQRQMQQELAADAVREKQQQAIEKEKEQEFQKLLHRSH